MPPYWVSERFENGIWSEISIIQRHFSMFIYSRSCPPALTVQGLGHAWGSSLLAAPGDDGPAWQSAHVTTLSTSKCNGCVLTGKELSCGRKPRRHRKDSCMISSAAPSMVECRTSVLGIGARASPAGILIPERKHLQKPAVGVHLF